MVKIYPSVINHMHGQCSNFVEVEDYFVKKKKKKSKLHEEPQGGGRQGGV